MIDHVGTRTLPDLLSEQVDANPDKPWLVWEDRDGCSYELSYAAFAGQVQSVTGGLASLGIGQGDAVVVHLRNRPEFLLTWFALASLGAIMVPSNVANTHRELGHIIDHAEAVAVVTEPDYLDTITPLVAERDAVACLVLAAGDGSAIPATVAFEDLVAHAPLPAVTEVTSDDVMEMIFTSGTTAAPKAVMLTHANALHSGERAVHALGLQRTDRCLTALPVFHVNAQSLTILAALTAGGTVVLLEEFSARAYWDQVRRHRATCTSLVAMQVRTLLAQPATPSDPHHDLRRVMYAINVTDDEKEAFERRFGVQFLNGYGLSEAMTLVTISPVFGPQRWPSIGRPAVDRTVRILDEDGQDVPTGQVGEIVVGGTQGRTLMKGYFKDPEATAAALRDGWLHTGDNGYVDDYGYVYFFDRKKDVIKRAGENISASEVEAALVTHPEIAEAAVIGVPDPIRDEAVKAFVVCIEGSSLTDADVLEHCRTTLAAFKVPTEIEFLASLPKTSIGKIEKRSLRGDRVHGARDSPSGVET